MATQERKLLRQGIVALCGAMKGKTMARPGLIAWTMICGKRVPLFIGARSTTWQENYACGLIPPHYPVPAAAITNAYANRFSDCLVELWLDQAFHAKYE